MKRLLGVVRGAPKRFATGAALLSSLGLFLLLRNPRPGSDVTEASLLSDFPALSWCAEGLEPIAGGGCYAAPIDAKPHAPLPLLIYLHGIFEKGALEDEERDRQRRVARKATSRGFAVIALRGKEGACTTTADRANLVCWPSNERTASRAEAFVEGWGPALKVAAKRHPFDEKYVLGFSNGGYFAGLVAERALYDANAFAIAHAGPVEPVKASGRKPPLLLLSADEDISQEGMVRLDDELSRDEWPHAHYVRDGGHALPDSDIEIALTFFERTRSETLPLRPPLSSRVPKARSVRRETEAVGSLPASASGAPNRRDESSSVTTTTTTESDASASRTIDSVDAAEQ